MWPPPRIPVNTRIFCIVSLFVWESLPKNNLYLPLLLEKGHTQTYTVFTVCNIYIYYTLELVCLSIFGLNNRTTLQKNKAQIQKKTIVIWGIYVSLYLNIMTTWVMIFMLLCLVLRLKLGKLTHRTRGIYLWFHRESPPISGCLPWAWFLCLGWWQVKIFLGEFRPDPWGKDPIWLTHIFWNGLVQPPTSCCYLFLYCFFSFRYPRISYRISWMMKWPRLQKTYKVVMLTATMISAI